MWQEVLIEVLYGLPQRLADASHLSRSQMAVVHGLAVLLKEHQHLAEPVVRVRLGHFFDLDLVCKTQNGNTIT